MMRQILIAGAVAAFLAGCGGGGEDRTFSRPVEVWREGERAPAQSAGFCDRCNYEVFSGHRCGLTHPCALCGREAGGRHMHEVQWRCDLHEVTMSERHVCDDAKHCRTCRKDARSILGTRGCDRCYRQVPPARLQGITTYCQTCNQEVGANHLHGKTAYCRECGREAGANHVHDATRLCLEHGVEHAPDHAHGTTVYCLDCHRDAGPDHIHGRTEWCWRCGFEAVWPHAHHD